MPTDQALFDDKTFRAGLEAVRDRLRSGAIPRDNFDMNEVLIQEAEDGTRLFGVNPQEGYEQLIHCGTAGCIAGWLTVELGCRDYNEIFSEAHGELDHLFYPTSFGASWDSITPAEAAQAIDNYLDFGKPCWDVISDARHNG